MIPATAAISIDLAQNQYGNGGAKPGVVQRRRR
jgi:hypothetical protein